MSAGRICVREVNVVQPTETAQDAARRMRDRKAGTLVVLNQAQEPVGIVSDRDLAVKVVADARDSSQTPVSEVMTPLPRTVQEDAPIETVLSLMRSGSFRRVPVVDKTRRLVGLLSLDDILELLSEEFQQIGELLEEERPDRVTSQPQTGTACTGLP